MQGKKRKAETLGDSKNGSAIPPKRRADYSHRDIKLAGIFEDLAENQKEKRLQAAIDLVNIIKSLDINDPGGETTAQTVERILLRLLRGLCSNRKAARLGYFTALIEILQLQCASVAAIGTTEIIQLINVATKHDETSSKQELREHSRGRLTGYSALIQSGLPEKSSQTGDLYEQLADAICGLMIENKSLREEAGSVLCEAVKSFKLRSCPPVYARLIMDAMNSRGLLKTPEGLAVWLATRTHFPDSKMPKHIWHHNDPLSKKEIMAIAALLKLGQIQEHAQGDLPDHTQTGTRQIKPHFVWNLIFRALVLKDEKSSVDGLVDIHNSHFGRFWLEAVDDIYFATNASLERKSLGLQLFSYVVENLPSQAIKISFSPKLSNCLYNQAAKPQRYLHQTATQLLKMMASRAKSDADTAVQIVETLITGNGVVDFDKRTNSKTVQSIITGIDKTFLEPLVLSLLNILCRPSIEDERRAHVVRQTITDYLLTVIRTRGIADLTESEKAAGWLKSVLTTFANIGLLESASILQRHGSITPTISEKTKAMLSSRLESILSYLISVDRVLILDCLEIVMTELRTRNPQDISALKLADAKVVNILSSSHKTLDGMKTSRTNGQSSREAFQLLISMSLFQAYAGETDAFEVLERLQESYAEDKNAKGESGAFDAVIEEIMGLVSKQSALYRKLGQQTFSAFASCLSRDGLNSMLDVLGQRENLSGQQALFEPSIGGDDMGLVDGSDGSVEESSEASDVEILEENGAEAEASEESSSDVSEAEADDEAARFDKLLAQTLKTKIPTANGVGADDEDSSSSDESMDDEQMMELEPQLTRVFEERRKAATPNKKQEQKDAKQNIINFKNRVLDLLLVFVKQQHANPIALGVILPLLQLIKTTKTKQISDKSSELLRQFFDVAKSRGLPSIEDPEAIYEVLEDVHTEALEFPSKSHASACSRSSIFLGKCLIGVDGVYRKKLGYLYADTMERALEQSSGTPASFWTEFSQWLLSARKSEKLER